MKNRLGFALLLVVVAAVLVLGDRLPSAAQNASPQAGANGAPPLLNPLKVALLRWYKANTVFTTFPVGKEPVGIAFDGASIWTANSGDDTVTKLRASDGTVLGTFSSGSFAGQWQCIQAACQRWQNCGDIHGGLLTDFSRLRWRQCLGSERWWQ